MGHSFHIAHALDTDLLGHQDSVIRSKMMRMIHQHVQVGRRLLVRVALKIALAAREVVLARHLVRIRSYSRILSTCYTIICAGMHLL